MSRPERKRNERLEVYEAFSRDLIRSHEWNGATRRVARILAPVDFSACSMWALRHAEEMARRFGAELVLVHVDPVLPLGSDLVDEEIAGCKELDELVTLLRERGMVVRGLLRAGAPIEEIMRAASAEHADLIVMGTHGRRGLEHVLMGSVAESVLRRASCPVLTVRHAPER